MRWLNHTIAGFDQVLKGHVHAISVSQSATENKIEDLSEWNWDCRGFLTYSC